MWSEETTHIETNMNWRKISVPERQIILMLQEKAEKLGWVLLPEWEDMKNMVIAFSEEILANFAGYEVETFLGKLLAKGEATRYSESDVLLSDELRQREYTFGSLPMNEKKRSERKGRLYDWLKDGHAFGKTIDSEDKHLKKEVGKWIEASSLAPATVVAYQVLQNAYPIEILKKLDVDHTEIENFAFSIVQMEKLIREKRIHKVESTLPSKYNAFFVKRMDNTIRLVSMYSGGNAQPRDYSIRAIPYNEFEGTLRAVVENSMLFLNIPKDDMSIPHAPIK